MARARTSVARMTTMTRDQQWLELLEDTNREDRALDALDSVDYGVEA